MRVLDPFDLPYHVFALPYIYHWMSAKRTSSCRVPSPCPGASPTGSYNGEY